MEAQPIALVIALLTLIVAGPSATAPLGVGSITLVALRLLWWAMVVEHIVRRAEASSPTQHHIRSRPYNRGRRLAWLHQFGWLVAFSAVAGPSLLSLARGVNIPAVLVDTVLVTWFWRRGMQRAQTGFEYDQLARSFKISFGVLLGILFLVIVLPELQALRDTLATALPIFFLSGLLMLSLARLGAIRNARRTVDGSQDDPTRAWLLALTIFGITLVAIVIVIESLFSFASFELVVTALTPLWNALGTFVNWILYAIIIVILSPIFSVASFLFGLLTGHSTARPQHQNIGPEPSRLHQPWNAQTIPPELLTIGRWILLALAAIVVLLVVQASLRRWFTMDNDEGIEEVREGLDARSLLGQHWRGWWNRWRRKTHEISALEPLDPTSVRARYREMLQAIATANDDLARNPAETPAEYESRLLTHLDGGRLQDSTHTDDVPNDTAILNELTRAYSSERYGGKHTDDHKRAFLRTWMPRLMKRLVDTSPRR